MVLEGNGSVVDVDVFVVATDEAVCILHPRAGGVKYAGLVIGLGTVDVVGGFVVDGVPPAVVVGSPGVVVELVVVTTWWSAEVVVVAREKCPAPAKLTPEVTRPPSVRAKAIRSGHRRVARASCVRAARVFIALKLVPSTTSFCSGERPDNKKPGRSRARVF